MKPEQLIVMVADQNYVTASLVALVGSFVVALINFVIALYTSSKNLQVQKEIESTKADLTKEVELYKHALEGQSAEQDARRDYEYEARKRLYQDIEPLLFQLVEFSESAQHRIMSLARACRDGSLMPDGSGWLKGDKKHDYYRHSSMYRLLRPLAVLRLMQKKLTTVDLSLDPHIEDLYLLAKVLYWTFSDHFDLARQSPAVDYAPDRKGPDNLPQHVNQGVPIGMLDNIVDCFFDPKDASRIIGFGEFEAGLAEGGTFVPRMRVLLDAFTGFHPTTHPVLWRILIAQAHIYEALFTRAAGRGSGGPGAAIQFPQTYLGDLEWRRPEEGHAAMAERPDVAAAIAYVERSFRSIRRMSSVG